MNFNSLLKYGFACALSILIVNMANAIYSKKIGHEKPTFSYEIKPWYKYDKDGLPSREVILYYGQHQPKGKLSISIFCNGSKRLYDYDLHSPIAASVVLLPPNVGMVKSEATITVVNAGDTLTQTILVPAKKQWKVYIYPHSHVDIGYTNVQDVVEKLHIRNIDVGIDIANKTKDYPLGARFIWNPESTWVVDQYLKQASPDQKSSFIAAVRKGWIQIDAAYANINTSTCSDEELLQMFRTGKEIEKLTGIPVQTMVQMDNPGAAWGMVQAAAANGIKGFFSFPNYFDLRHRWENKPFYWKGQDGSKIFYLQATSYGYGFKAKGRIYGLGKIQALTPAYDRLSTDRPLENFIDPFIFEETARLERNSSPYDIFAMTWSMADNCLIDADLPEAVKLWNQKYAFPKLIIAGTKEILAAYEQQYKDVIPTYEGDLSEFWTQGLGADAKSVGKGRLGKEDLIQAQTLWPMLNINADQPNQQINSAWDDALLSAEHTWGFQDPNAPMAKIVEANKAGYFSAVQQKATILIDQAFEPIQKKGSNGFAVINTLSWDRDGVVVLSPSQSKKGDRVVDENNKPVLSQRLKTGELAFEATNIPALGSKFFKVITGSAKSGPTMVGENQLHNQRLKVVLDQSTGDIKSLVDLSTNRELVDQQSVFGFNSYN
ncbi:MAG: hypothetical protein REI93_08420, partial [Pedobacter sp.]|nr:hypothetical protein [Pedobacter sp.]